MQEIKKGQAAFEIHQKVIETKQDIEYNFIKLGSLLKEIRDKKIYEELNYDTFEAYIAQPELSLHRSTVFMLIGVYEDFYEKSNQLDLVNIGLAKLDRIRQFKDREDFGEWIKRAEVLSLSDLNAVIREAKGITTVSEVPEPETIEITCPYCGKVFDYIIRRE